MEIDIKVLVKSLFSEKIIFGLRQFVERIDDENPDLIVLIARKAVCLFDLLEYLDIEKPSAEIVSDRVLNLDIDYIKNKKVVVVDDSLILGTTLKKIKELLRENDIDNKIFVYCVDKDNWSKKLIVPDYIQELMSSDDVYNFCLSEVKAFSLVSRPYIVDFPISNYGKLSNFEFNNLLLKKDVNIIEVPVNNIYGINKVYTCIFGEHIKEKYFAAVGVSLKDIIDLIKVRLYICEDDSCLKLRIMPIVLFLPLSFKDVDGLFEKIISEYDKEDVFYAYVKDYRLKLRFVQYYFSYKLGEMFIDYMNDCVVFEEGLYFKSSEIINLLGKEVGNNFELIAKQKTKPIDDYVFENVVINDAKENHDVLSKINIKDNNVLSSFQKIFSDLYTHREIPAREKVRSNNLDSEKLDRLSKGLSFGAIIEKFMSILNVNLNENIKELFSIYLDICNDMGLSVPVVCTEGDVCYRGFRHGELGLRTEMNMYLYYLFLKNYIERSGRSESEGIPSLLLEKLTVIFFRVGINKGYLDVTYDPVDPDAINMGFYLMGAVMVKNINGYFPKNRTEWFTGAYCDDYLKYDPERKRYYLVERDEDKKNNIIPVVKDGRMHSQMLGKIFGAIYPKTKVSQKNPDNNQSANKISSPIDINKLIILSSCYSASDLLMALTVELKIMRDWIEIASQNKINYENINDLFEGFKYSVVYTSFNQAMLKLKSSISKKKILNI